MNSAKDSVTYRILLLLWRLYSESFLWRLTTGILSACHNSLLGAVLRKRNPLTEAWSGSVTCRALTFAVNIPAKLLSLLYGKLERVFDGSIFARFMFRLGTESAVAAAWVLTAIMIVPYKHWNNAYSLAGFAVVVLLFIIGGMRHKKLRFELSALNPYLVAFAAAAVLAVAFSRYRSLSTRFLGYHLSCMLCVLVTVSAVKDSKQLVRLAGGAALGTLVIALYGIYQRIQGIEVNPSYVDLTVNAGIPGRIFSFYDNPNAFAEVLMIMLPMILALVVCSRRWTGKLAALGVFCIGTAALLMTYSRASWVGFAVAIVVFVFMWNVRLVPVGAVLCVLFVPLLPQTVLNRIGTITNMNDLSTSSRFPLFRAAIKLIKASPIRGAGLGTPAVKQYITDYNLYSGRGPFVHAHDIFLQVWAEMGVLGIVSFVTGMVCTIREGIRAVKTKVSAPVRMVTIGGVSAICGSLVCGLADYLWNYPRVMCLFWYMVAVALAGIKLCKAEAAK